MTMPNIPLRQTIWRVLSCQDGIVTACLESYNKQRRKLIMGELKRIIEEMPPSEAYSEVQIRERASQTVGKVFPQLMTK